MARLISLVCLELSFSNAESMVSIPGFPLSIQKSEVSAWGYSPSAFSYRFDARCSDASADLWPPIADHANPKKLVFG
jgi:hypothetical protein